jgi:hypothetical protein
MTHFTRLVENAAGIVQLPAQLQHRHHLRKTAHGLNHGVPGRAALRIARS